MHVTPEELAVAIRTVLEEVSAEGSLALPIAEVPDPRVERPHNRDHDDWSTSVTMRLAKETGTKPRDLVELLVPRLETLGGIASMEIAGPGFLNIRLSAASAGELARSIIEAGKAYGRNDSPNGQYINLEYVSTSPAGPVHLGGARWAAVGNSLAQALSTCGTQVTREYYFNGHGTQIDRFVRSLLASARGQKTPGDGYGGAYISEIAQQMTADEFAAGRPDPTALSDVEATEIFRSRGVDLMFAAVKAELHAFRSDFDVFFHESSLHTSGTVERTIARLHEHGVIRGRDGATWLRTTDFGDDKDRVLIKSDSNATYFVADLICYLDKRKRGADCAIYLLGADHHDYIGRMMAIYTAFGGIPGTSIQALIGQLVNLVHDGVPVHMSKRVSTIVTLKDLIDAVGVDTARYALTRSLMDSMIDIDLGLLTSSTSNSPVYYIQYAHARTRDVTRNAAEHGVSHDPNKAPLEPDALDDPADTALLEVLAQFPATVTRVAQLCKQHHVACYLERLTVAYHAWYDATRVTSCRGDAVGSGHVARLWLSDTVGQVLASGLNLLGVNAPERI